MIERISELPWASFEAQLIQKCKTYLFNTHKTLVGEVPQAGTYWKTYRDLNAGDLFADEVYCIQQQIMFNAVALNDELNSIKDLVIDSSDRFKDSEVLFWNDLVQHQDPDTHQIIFDHEGYENTLAGRGSQLDDKLFSSNITFTSHPYTTTEEAPDLLTSLPKTHAAQSLIEVSEYVGPNNPEAKHSNYVSRKVSMLWFFNVIKAIVRAVRVFQWMKIGSDGVSEPCRHDEAEAEPDVDNEHTRHGSHRFLRSRSPATDGSLKVYGNAELNGKVTTFHSQARFHDEVTMWDKLSVYGQSYFSKDINGTAMHVRWGDLAEYYVADADYAPGTLVTFGGKEEVTVAISNANAVVTSNPGLVLNEEMKLKTNGPEHPVGLALVGRVPVKVWGHCKKFDGLVADPEHPGWARVQIFDSEHIIARALQDKDESDHLVLCATNFRI